MRHVSVLFVVVLLLLVGCSGTPDQLAEKATSSISVSVAGEIDWDITPDTTLWITIHTYPLLVKVGSLHASTSSSGYRVDNIQLPDEGNYMFIPQPPSGYSATPNWVIVNGITNGSLSNVSFDVE